MSEYRSKRGIVAWSWAAAMAGALFAGSAQAGPTMAFGEQGSATFTYAAQLWNTDKKFDTPGVTDNDRLYLRRHRFTLSGQFNDYVGFYTQLEAGAGMDAQRKTYFRDAYLTLDYTDELRFIAGEFKNTFTRENLEACLEPLTLDRSELLAYTPFGGTRDRGIAVWGNLLDAKLQYRFMSSWGRPDGDGKPSDNRRYTSRVHYSLLDPESNYGYLGTYLGTAKVFTVGAAYDYQAKVVYNDYLMHAEPQDYRAWTVDAFFEYPFESGVYTLSGAVMEYDSGNAANLSLDPAYPVSGDMKGYYLKGGYMFPGKIGPGRLQLFARQEGADYSKRLFSNHYFDRTARAIGVNYYLNGQKLKLTAEYSDAKFDAPHPVDASLRDTSQLTIGLQFIY